MKHTVEEDGHGETAVEQTLAQRRTKAEIPLSRFPIQRFRIILTVLQKGETTARHLAAELEVSTKTIQRDLDFMRDRLEFPIECDWKGIHLTRPIEGCPICAIIHARKPADHPTDEDRTTELLKRIFRAL